MTNIVLTSVSLLLLLCVYGVNIAREVRSILC